MDVMLIKDGVVENIVRVESLELAGKLWPGYTLVERTPEHGIINPGDPAP